MRETLARHLALTKPGIVLGQVAAIAAGFFLAAHGGAHPAPLFGAIAGGALMVAAGGVLNNYLDRDIDARMARTKDRPTARGLVPQKTAITYASLLGILGFAALALFTNPLAVASALIGFFFYTVVYTLWWKRRSPFGIPVGSVSGAMPPLIGYAAGGGGLDAGAAILFAVLVLWQMPHFYAIAIRRRDDYAAAAIPTLPARRGARHAKARALGYILAFAAAAGLLFAYGYVGKAYLMILVILTGGWFTIGVWGFFTRNDERWARAMFITSLLVIMGFFFMIAMDATGR